DGNHLVDCVLSWVLILAARAHPGLVGGVSDSAAQGSAWGSAGPLQSDLPRRWRALVPLQTQWRSLSSATEAASAAQRVAPGSSKTCARRRAPLTPCSSSTK